MMYRYDDQNVGPEVQNHEDDFLGFGEEKDCTVRPCLYWIAETLFWGLMVALAYLLICIAIGYAIP